MFAAIELTPGPFIALMALGFLIGTIGHVYKSTITIVVGITLIFAATLLVPLAIHLSGA